MNKVEFKKLNGLISKITTAANKKVSDRKSFRKSEGRLTGIRQLQARLQEMNSGMVKAEIYG